MDPLITKTRDILKLVRYDASLHCGSKDPLCDQGLALLAQASLAHVGIGASAIYTILHAMRNDSIKSSMTIAALDLHLKSGLVRMNLIGDIGDDLIPGIVRAWERDCKRVYPGSPLPSRWCIMDPKSWSKHRSEDYFSNRGGSLLAQTQATSLCELVPQTDQSCRAGPRL